MVLYKTCFIHKAIPRFLCTFYIKPFFTIHLYFCFYLFSLPRKYLKKPLSEQIVLTHLFIQSKTLILSGDSAFPIRAGIVPGSGRSHHNFPARSGNRPGSGYSCFSFFCHILIYRCQSWIAIFS